MGILVVRGNQSSTFPVNGELLHRLPDPKEFTRLLDLTVGIDADGDGVQNLPQRPNRQVDVCGKTCRLWLPDWLKVPESTASRSTSHAQYIAQGDWTPNPAHSKKRVGVLLQLLPKGRETSCHSHPALPEIGHPGTIEFFLPLSTPTPILYTPEGAQPIPPEGCWVDVGVPHQLQAVGADTLTLIVMWEMHRVTWMGGHVRHDPPFVPYTALDL